MTADTASAVPDLRGVRLAAIPLTAAFGGALRRVLPPVVPVAVAAFSSAV